MYLEFWNLRCFPFENAPDSHFFFESKVHREAAMRLQFSIQTRKAIALLTGDYGSGKSVVCQSVLGRLPANEYKIALVTNPRMDAVDLTREIAYQFGEDIQTRSKYDVLHAFNNLLARHHTAGRHCAAIIDEAQLVEDGSVLEDLRLLLNQQVAGAFLMTLVLVGQTELNDKLRAIPQMFQRIGFKFHIPHLAADEVKDYIRHRMETAGGTVDIFEENALVEIQKVSKGNPREINALCDLCLLNGALAEDHKITTHHVADAARERM